MMKSVQTHRLSTPGGLNLLPGPPTTPFVVKRLSRTGSSLSSCSSQSHSNYRLSCAPDDSLVLALALTPTSHNKPSIPRPPMPASAPPRPVSLPANEESVSQEDPLYEEIYSRISNLPAVAGSGNNAAEKVPGESNATKAAPPADPPKLTPVSGVLHNKSPTLIRPLAFKPYVRSPNADSPSAKSTTVSPKTPLPPSNIALISPPNSTITAVEAKQTEISPQKRTSARQIAKSFSDPWKGTSHRKSTLNDYKSRSTPSSIREDPAQHVYYPSSSDKSSYGYISCSDQSVDSLYGAHKTYHARMIRTEDEDTSLYGDAYHVTSTPSPSDSGIAISYETLLREKDNEIIALRKTMEHNESVIFKVHEEKESCWRKQMDALRNHYESHLQKLSLDHLSQQGDLTRSCDHLRQQNTRLHQQVKTAIECKTTMENSIRDLETTIKETQSRLDDANWVICEKSGQISLLKKMRPSDQSSDTMCQQIVQLQNKLDSAQKEALQRNAELKDLRQTLNFLSQELYQVQQKFDAAREELDQKQEKGISRSSRRASVANPLQDFEPSEVERLKREVAELKAKSSADKKKMEEERSTWFEEKEKVIKYQKQLQLNYLEVYKRNCSLETELVDINASLRINDMMERPDSVRESDC